MSFLRNSSLRQAFESITLKNIKDTGAPVFNKVWSGLERRVGLVREHDKVLVRKRTKEQLNKELGLGLK